MRGERRPSITFPARPPSPPCRWLRPSGYCHRLGGGVRPRHKEMESPSLHAHEEGGSGQRRGRAQAPGGHWRGGPQADPTGSCGRLRPTRADLGATPPFARRCSRSQRPGGRREDIRAGRHRQERLQPVGRVRFRLQRMAPPPAQTYPELRFGLLPSQQQDIHRGRTRRQHGAGTDKGVRRL